MLTLIEFASRTSKPHQGPVDRDPGFVTLAVQLVKAARRGIASIASGATAAHRRVNGAEWFGSSSAWPHKHSTR